MKKRHVAIACLIVLTGCGTMTRKVSVDQLQHRLDIDNKESHEKNCSRYHWAYIGSDDSFHYFRRQVLELFYSEYNDGIYAVPKSGLALGNAEFQRPSPDNSSIWKDAFTQIDPETLIATYDISFGVITNPMGVFTKDMGEHVPAWDAVPAARPPRP